MARTQRLTPRKEPQQERSRATVECIVEAGTRVLVAHGYDGASTNRIAAAAGVSPGSLYQYFPNKDAIIVAVVERYSSDLAMRMADQMTSLLDARPETLIRTMLAALVDAIGEQPEILRAVVEQIPRREGIHKLAHFERRIEDLTRAYLMLHRDVIRDADLDTAVWILVQLAQQLCIRYVLDGPSIPREQFIDELAKLCGNYLARARVAPASG